MSSIVDPEVFQRGFDALPFEIAMIDSNGEIVFVNERWTAFGEENGATHDSYWVGENYLDICWQATDSTATAVANGLEELLAGNRHHFRQEYPCHPPDDQRWFLLEASTVSYDDHRYGLVAHVDITERKRAEIQRNIRIEQMETIVDVLAHDLRNPLSIVRGYTDQLSTTDTEDNTVAAIQNGTDRMTEIIDTVLEFARTKRVDELHRVSLAEIARESWDQTPTADASLAIESSRQFSANEPLFRQILENLFRNAAEHGGNGVTVRVGVTGTEIYVEDDGCGISRDIRTDIEASGGVGESKTGLGLAIVRTIVTAHNWSLSVTEGRDGGARFEISGIEFHEDT